MLHYEQLSLLDIDGYDPRKDSNKNIPNPWVANKPLFFITHGLSLLNANPYKLIDALISNINELYISIEERSELDVKNSDQFFVNFSAEI